MNKIQSQFFTPEQIHFNNKRILSLKDKEKGKSIIIMGPSTSINDYFIDKIRDRITIGVNGVGLVKDIWNFEPTYYCLSEAHIFHNFYINDKFTMNDRKCDTFYNIIHNLNSSIKIFSDLVMTGIYTDNQHKETNRRLDILNNNVHIPYINNELMEGSFHRNDKISIDSISLNLLRGTFAAGSVIFDLAIPLASWLGAKNIYLIGCSSTVGHFYDYDNLQLMEKFKASLGKMSRTRSKYVLYKNKLNESGVNLFNLDSNIIEGIKRVEINEIV